MHQVRLESSIREHPPQSMNELPNGVNPKATAEPFSELLHNSRTCFPTNQHIAGRAHIFGQDGHEFAQCVGERKPAPTIDLHLMGSVQSAAHVNDGRTNLQSILEPPSLAEC
ncbi:MAG: hypothetical protein HY646_05980 [Acidobacteria bacterium]|nr:hypothetical protein [Acidobacteriota bacterium]